MTIHRKEKHGKRLQSKTHVIHELRHILNIFHRFKTSFMLQKACFTRSRGEDPRHVLGKENRRDSIGR